MPGRWEASLALQGHPVNPASPDRPGLGGGGDPNWCQDESFSRQGSDGRVRGSDPANDGNLDRTCARKRSNRGRRALNNFFLAQHDLVARIGAAGVGGTPWLLT